MENLDNTKQNKKYRKNHFSPSGRILAGLILVTVGAVLLAKKMGADIPHWLFSWEILLILIGLFIGAKRNFRGLNWLAPIVVGTVFMLDDFFPEIPIKQYLWPALIIVIGLFMIFRPRGKRCFGGDCRTNDRYSSKFTEPVSSENMIDSVSIFGGVKKNIISKDFKGGEITCVFGGAEINLTQADINGKAVLEMTQIFGGTKLIVPANWNVQSEVTAILGGIEDRRPQTQENLDENKILILKGTTIFGGIDIRSY